MFHSIYLDYIVYVFFDTLSGIEPHQVGVQLAAGSLRRASQQVRLNL
jgi:hypothetical protein